MNIFFIFICFSVFFTESATDFYLPLMPQLSHVLGVSEQTMNFSISLFLVAFCFSGLIYGPISDVYGRRRILLIGYSIFTLASLALAASCHNITFFLLFRTLQGVGSGALWVLILAMINDIARSAQRVRLIGYLHISIALTPGIAPLIGGYLAHWYTLFTPFWIMSIICMFIWMGFFFWMPESASQAKRVSLQRLFQQSRFMLTHLNFWKYGMMPTLALSGTWCYFSTFPFTWISKNIITMHEYGWYTCVYGLSSILGSYLNGRLTLRYKSHVLLRFGAFVACLGALAVIYGCVMNQSVLLIIIMMGVYTFGNAFIYAHAPGLMFTYFPEMGGVSSALMHVLENSGAALAIVIAGMLCPIHIAWVAVFVSMLMFINLWICCYASKKHHEKRHANS